MTQLAEILTKYPTFESPLPVVLDNSLVEEIWCKPYFNKLEESTKKKMKYIKNKKLKDFLKKKFSKTHKKYDMHKELEKVRGLATTLPVERMRFVSAEKSLARSHYAATHKKDTELPSTVRSTTNNKKNKKKNKNKNKYEMQGGAPSLSRPRFLTPPGEAGPPQAPAYHDSAIVKLERLLTLVSGSNPFDTWEYKATRLMEKLLTSFIEFRAIINAENRAIRIAGILAFISSQISHYTNESIAIQVLEMVKLWNVKDHLSDSSSEEDFDTQANMGDSIHAVLKSMSDGWRHIGRASPLIQVYFRVASLLTTLGFCEASGVTFTIGGFKVFEEEIGRKFTNISDIVECTIRTLDILVTTGFRCFTDRSLLPFLTNGLVETFFKKEGDLCLKLGAYQLGNLFKEYNIRDKDLDRQYTSFIKEMDVAISSANNEFTKRTMLTVSKSVHQQYVTFKSIKAAGRDRVPPFVIGLIGKPGVGKTNLIPQLLSTFFSAIAVDFDPSRHQMVWNNGDQYQSAFHNSIKAIIMDDPNVLRNPVVTFAEWFIKICNPAAASIAKAGVDEKTGLEVNADVVIATTNNPDWNSNEECFEPGAVLRRFDMQVEVVPRPEYCAPGTQMLNSAAVYAAFPPEVVFRDLWKFNVYKSVVDPEAVGKHTTRREDLAEGIGYRELLILLTRLAREHKACQDALLTMKEKSLNVPLCKGCNLPNNMCGCEVFQMQDDGEDEQLAPELIFPEHGMNLIHQWDTSGLFKILSKLPNLGTDSLIDLFLGEDNWTKWIIKGIQYREKVLFGYVFMQALTLLCSGYYALLWFIFSLFVLVYAKVVVDTVSNSYFSMIRPPSMWKKFVYKCTVPVGITASALLFIYGVQKLLTFVKIGFQTHAALTPRKDDTENPWAKPIVRPPPVNHAQRTNSLDELTKKMERCICVIHIPRLDGTIARSNACVLATGILLIPKHMTKDMDPKQKSTISFEAFGANGTSSKLFIDKSRIYEIPNKDFALCFWANSGSRISLLNYFPELERKDSALTRFMVRDINDCSFTYDQCVLQPKIVQHSELRFDGFVCDHSFVTETGMCMGAHLTQKHPTIFSFHLGGKGSRGISDSLIRSEIEAGMQWLTTVPGVVMTAEETTFDCHFGTTELRLTAAPPVKSAVNFVSDTSRFTVYGGIDGDYIRPRSKVKDTEIKKLFEETTGIPCVFGPPRMTGPGIYRFTESLEKLAQGSQGWPQHLLTAASYDLRRQVLEGMETLPDHIKVHIRPLTIEESITGIPGIKFLDGVKLSSGMGFPLGKTKGDWIDDVLDTEGRLIGRIPKPELRNEIEKYFDAWDNGQRRVSLGIANLKDEPMDIRKDKTRVFTVMGGDLHIACGTLTKPIWMAIMQTYLTSETAVGRNPYSPDWEILYRHMTRFGEDRIIAGDFSGFDKRLSADVLMAAWWVIIEIARWAGYSELHLNRMRMMMSETLYSYQSYDGALIRVIGSLISGEDGTIYKGGFCNGLLVRMVAFNYCDEKNIPYPRFDSMISLIDNGDDQGGSVNPKYSDLDQLYMADVLTRHGNKYTSAEKGDVTERFTPPEKFIFLQRTTVQIEGVPWLVGRMTEDSHTKCLVQYIPSKDICERERTIAALGVYMREDLLYGREKFETSLVHIGYIADVLGIKHLIPELNQTYDEATALLVSRYEQKDDNTVSEDGTANEPQACQLDDHDVIGLSLTDVDGGFGIQSSVELPSRVCKTHNKRKSRVWSLTVLLLVGLCQHVASNIKETGPGADTSGMTEKPSNIGETVTQISEFGSMQQENLYSHEETTNWTYRRDDALSDAHKVGDMSSLDLMGFISRPILGTTLTWNVGTALEGNFNPWQLFFNNPVIREKLKFFYRLRTRMSVRFQIVGNQFSYGRILVAYQPFVSQNGQNLNQMYPWPGLTGAFTPTQADLCLLSQYPHIYLDPVNSSGGEIEVPFIWYRNYFEVPTEDWLKAGSIVYTTLSRLEAANGSTDPITIQVIIRPLDLHMDLPTEYEPQMNIVKAVSQFDPSHPISSGLGVAAEGAGMLAKAKGKKKNKKAQKFAKGTKTAQLALKMAGNAASKYGFTRQPNAMGTNTFTPQIMRDMALTEGTAPSVPLTCFKDSQITVAPDRYGAGLTDELVITAIACKEAYYNKFVWNVADAPGANLFAVEVSPAISVTDPITGLVGMTPMCYAVQPFEFWSGTILFRFQVVASNFHKGVIIIKYDPDAQATGTSLNLQTLATIDIAKDRDVTVEVGMSQIVPWLYHRSVIPLSGNLTGGGSVPPYNVNGPFLNNSGAIIPQTTGDLVTNWRERLCLNGVLSIQVFNTLVIPANASSTFVEVLCHASAGSDFKVASPTDMYIRDMTFFPNPPPQQQQQDVGTQTDEISSTVEQFAIQMDTSMDTVDDTDGAPEALTIAHHFGGELGEEGACPDMFMGETIQSLRVLLHRMQYYTAVLDGTLANLVRNVRTTSDFPQYPGNGLTSLNGATRAVVDANMTMLHYVTAAFALRSGSITNYYYIVQSSTGNIEFLRGPLGVSRAEKGAPAFTQQSVLPSAAGSGNERDWIYNGNFRVGASANISGQHVVSQQQIPGVDVIVPYYDNLTGYPAQMSAVNEGNVFTRCHRLELFRKTNTATLRYVACGPDYNVGWFLSAPPVYVRDFNPN